MAIIKTNGHCKKSFSAEYLRPITTVRITHGKSFEFATALFDTGADVCAISPWLLNRFDAVPAGNGTISGVLRSLESPVYLFEIEMDDTIHISNAETMILPNHEDKGIDFIIGMNVLSLGEFIIHNNYTFDFIV